MEAKIKFDLGNDREAVMFIGAGLALCALVGALDYTDMLMPLARWFGVRGFAGLPVVLVLMVLIIRLPAWVTPAPKWLTSMINSLLAVITAYMVLTVIVLVAVASAMLQSLS